MKVPAVGLSALLLALGACGDDDGSSAKPQAANPLVEGPVTGGGGEDSLKVSVGGILVDLRSLGFTRGTPFYGALYFDEAELGYRDTEYFISGTATSYGATGELGEDGVWSARHGGIPRARRISTPSTPRPTARSRQASCARWTVT